MAGIIAPPQVIADSPVNDDDHFFGCSNLSCCGDGCSNTIVPGDQSDLCPDCVEDQKHADGSCPLAQTCATCSRRSCPYRSGEHNRVTQECATCTRVAALKARLG